MPDACSGCDEIRTEPIPAIGNHLWGPYEIVDETTHRRVCERDASHVLTEEHEFSRIEVIRIASCSEPGEQKATCEVCGFSKTIETPKAPHTPKVLEAKPATCAEDGNEAGEVCAVCGEILSGGAAAQSLLESAQKGAPIGEAVLSLGKGASVRGETLTLEEFARLADVLLES